MKPKYRNGQKVRIKETRNQHGNLIYLEIQKYINELGTIEDIHIIPIKNLPGQSLEIDNQPIYKVHLDRDIELNAVPEDALEIADK